jgi:hypothetical protein
MDNFRLRLRPIKIWACIAVTAVGLGPILGCGDDTGLDKRYPVSGTVTYKDQPIESGQISFIPADPNKQRPANGMIENGRYTLTTMVTGDGALPGEYAVTIKSQEVDNTKILETVKKYGGGGRQQEIAQATAKAKNLIPAKYQLPETGRLKATVKETSNTLDFKLTD